ncbi:MAG: restriction endonuclease subunit S [Candidatus Methanomethylicaceae archaeon]|jgi:type I restriction enzyme S subunit
MSSKLGYKQTEIGEVPEEWGIKKLGDIISLEYGRSLPVQKRIDGKIPVFGSNGIVGFHNESMVTQPGIVVGRKGTVGAIQWVTTNFWAIDTTYYISVKDDKMNLKWLYYLLIFLELHRLNAATGVPGLNRVECYSQIIRLPPAHEQDIIASILSIVDDAIEKTAENIAKALTLKKGLMHQLLIKGVGHTRFKQTEIGEIPEEWKINILSSICEKPEYGYTQSAKEAQTGIKFLRITDIQDGKVDWNTVPYCECSDDLFLKYQLHEGDILFARTGATTGKSLLIRNVPKAVFASYLIRVRPTREITPEFLQYFFNSQYYWHQISQKKVGSAQSGINASILSTLVIQTPPIIEQQKITRILLSIDGDIENMSRISCNLLEIKEGLMRGLLTGRLRAKVN